MRKDEDWLQSPLFNRPLHTSLVLPLDVNDLRVLPHSAHLVIPVNEYMVASERIVPLLVILRSLIFYASSNNSGVI